MASFRFGLAHGLAAAVAIVFVHPAQAQDTQSPPPAAPVPAPAACRIVQAKLASPLNSASARNGTVFRFAIDSTDAAVPTTGYGVVNFVRGAGRGGKAGEIGLEARYAAMPDGSHIPATIIPPKTGSTHYAGSSRNAPAPLAALGGPVASGVAGVYGFVHSGSQAVVRAGTPLRIVLGDDYLTGGCTLT